MLLQLAEGPKKRRRGKVQVSGYKRRYPILSESEQQDDNPYIFLPNFETGGGVYIREDKFDWMPDDEWQVFIKSIASYQPQVINGLSENAFLASRADRKQRRQDRHDKKTAKTDLKKAKAEGKRSGANTGWLDKVGGIATSIFGKKDGGGGSDGSGGGSDQSTAPKTNFVKPLLIGAAVLTVAGVAYVATRPKKKAA